MNPCSIRAVYLQTAAALRDGIIGQAVTGDAATNHALAAALRDAAEKIANVMDVHGGGFDRGLFFTAAGLEDRTGTDPAAEIAAAYGVTP